MNDTAKGENVCIEELAKLAGFPVDLITKELFGGEIPEKDLSLQELRVKMMSYLDSAMLIDSEDKALI